MGLAVILVVIIGVMGAGLLVFVRNDLEAVVETNQGQEAFEAADAGMQAAERQLLSDNCPQSYDGEVAAAEDSDDGCADSEESDWSYEAVADENVETTDEEEAYVGRELGFESDDSDNITVTIRHLPFHEDDESCDEEPSDLSEEDHHDCAPEEQEGEDDARQFFRVDSEGESGSGEARRIVEGILYTYDLGVPKAYYSSSTEDDSIEIGGNAEIDGVSLFSQGGIDISGSAEITGEDLAYGDWENSPYNETPRPDTPDDDHLKAGAGAVGDISGGEDNRDFDGSPDPDSTEPEFVEDPGDEQGSGQITFPFEPEAQSGEADRERIQFWREEAQRQDNYYEESGNADLNEWPEDATDSTVVFVEFDDALGTNQLNWNVDGEGVDCDEEEAEANAKKGTLVVEGADLDPGGKGEALFSGATIIRGGDLADGDFESSGNPCWGGFVNADGQIDINGTADSITSQNVINRPGFYGVETWSWRELYE